MNPLLHSLVAFFVGSLIILTIGASAGFIARRWPQRRRPGSTGSVYINLRADPSIFVDGFNKAKEAVDGITVFWRVRWIHSDGLRHTKFFELEEDAREHSDWVDSQGLELISIHLTVRRPDDLSTLHGG